MSNCVKDIFSEVTEIWSLVPEPPFALDTNIASAVGEFRFQPQEKIHQLIERTLEIVLLLSDVIFIP